MDLVDVIMERKSIRAFKSDPVSKNLLKQIVEQALRAPSWANTQPWEFAIVTGKQLREIQKGFLKKGEEDPNPDIARPYEFPEPYLSRVKALAPKGVTPTKADMEARKKRNFEHRDLAACRTSFLLSRERDQCLVIVRLRFSGAEHHAACHQSWPWNRCPGPGGRLSRRHQEGY